MKKIIIISVLIILCFLTCTLYPQAAYIQFFLPDGDIQVSFSVTADMQNYTGCTRYDFDGVVTTIASEDPGDFMVSPGDV